MHEVKFNFEVDGTKVEKVQTYSTEPTLEQIKKDMQEWFMSECYMWFGYEENGVYRNLADYE
ncbi:hypothetical protein [Shouchella miscanthi]|uniref:hypothetical protein n=1 Tax=Shouchella miscanthi TaxID=2598861 RepID=UPI0011A31CB6|nr:hypothetical protein [Shouchella miscanthi]